MSIKTVIKSIEDTVEVCDICGKSKPQYKSLKAVCDHLDEKRAWWYTQDEQQCICYDCKEALLNTALKARQLEIHNVLQHLRHNSSFTLKVLEDLSSTVDGHKKNILFSVYNFIKNIL